MGASVVAAVCFAIACAAVWAAYRSKRSERETVQTIRSMLDLAKEGACVEEHFDESSLSALETEFARFLHASSASARNVETEKDRIKSLISDISHQTKTPIANIMLYSDLLAEEDMDDGMRANVQAICRQTAKLSFLVDSLVKLSRLENGILAVNPETHALQELLDGVAAQYASKAEAKGVALRVGETGASARFDPKWTAEAVGNLVDNAIKYAPEGEVAVGVREFGQFVCVDVADSGPGIPESEQAKVFGRFWRSPRFQEEEGVGVGLYLARAIVSAEGGYIKLKSEPGKGSVFSVFLPRV